MSGAPDARKLTGAAYQAARAKLIRGDYPTKPPAVAPKAFCDMSPEEYEAVKHPKRASEMTPAEYNVARKRITSQC